MSRVCVLGSFMMDLVVRAPRRPGPGETLIGSSFETFLGGKGFNQAVAASRAGAATSMIGRLGADEPALRFRACLEGEGIDDRHVLVDPAEGTGVGLPLVDDAGENSIVIVPRANHQIGPDDVERARAAIVEADVLLLQWELPVGSALAAARVARGAGVTVVLNPAPALGGLDGFAGLVDVLVPNQGEAAQLVGATDGDPALAAARLRDRLGTAVVVTLGADGAVVVDDRDTVMVPGHAVDLVDSVGAGDAFCGTLGAGLAAGLHLADAVARANAAGALAVTRAGAEPSLPTAAAVDELLARAPAY